MLFPDLNAYEDWSKRTESINLRLKPEFIISDFLEKNASETDKGNG